ncbi:MAG: trypsin-like peptidase domain-containing protein [Actinomycetota bacterium]|nr:trypsin-like peptidase domain-containing protein [Actinomycetota bacterium]
MGFVVAEQCVLTCAHVVNLALGRDKLAQDQPGEQDLVDLEFPLADDALCRARVQRWEPPPASGIRGGDIAGLVIVRGRPPSGVSPARLSAGAQAGYKVSLFGYPPQAGRPHGIWTQAEVQGEVGGGLLQIDAGRDAAWQAQPGFSGAPVINRETGTVVGMFKAASTVEERRDSYAIPTSLLRVAWEDVLIVLPPNPYQGLAAFTPDKAELFFGRDDETRLLVDTVRRSPLVVVIGPSGVGKSSLVQAGLVPKLSKEGWVWGGCRPSDNPDPFQTLAAALRRAEGGAGADVGVQRKWAEEIRDQGLARLAADLRTACGRRILLVVDQLEELFTPVEDGQVGQLVRDFLERLLELPQQLPGEHPMAVVATLRADFYHRLLAHPDAAPRLAGREVTLSPLGVTALREVIERPARAREVSYAPHLVDRIVADATTSEGALPLLEFALTELWSHQHRGQLNHEAYHEIGGVLGSLDRQGEHTVEELLDSGVTEPDIERTLIALISSSGREDLPATRRSCPAAELDDTQRRVAEALTRARLLTATRRHEQPCYELAHEALIGSWQRLHRAAEADGEFLRWRTRLEQWDEKRDGFPPEAWVAQGTHWCAQRDDVPPRLVDLIHRSQDELQRRVRELRHAHRRAEALRLAAQAQMELTRTTGATAALALAAESLGVEHTFVGDSAARAALRLAARPVSRLTHDDWVRQVVFSPDGTWVATASDDGTARVFDPTTGTERARLTHDGPVNGVRFSPDGTRVATASTDRTARVFDPTTGSERARLTHDAGVTAVAFSPDGTWVATASADRTARVFAVGIEELLAAVVAYLPRPLTDAEWQRYGGRPAEL